MQGAATQAAYLKRHPFAKVPAFEHDGFPLYETAAIERYLAGLSGVSAVHDLHIWAISTTETALTAHLVRPVMAPDDEFLRGVAAELKARFSIGHCTIQVEHDGADCHLAPTDVI